MCERFNEAVSAVECSLKQNLMNIPCSEKKCVSEIRLRVNAPVVIRLKNKIYFLEAKSKLQTTTKDAILSSKEEIKTTFTNMCNHSVYSYQNEIKNGFITLKGGHRVGICGTAVLSGEKVENIRDISSLNIRIARSIEGLTTSWSGIFKENFKGILIVGEPASGKTTVLRELARQLSSGFSRVKNVSIIDERNEISASYSGVSQFNLGLCDVLTGYPKNIGFEHAIRTLSPDVIICDEIGSINDVTSVEQAVNCGVKIIATFHSGNIKDLLNNSKAKSLLKTGAFDKIIILQGKEDPGEIFKIYNVEDLKDEICRRNNVSNSIGGNGLFSFV